MILALISTPEKSNVIADALTRNPCGMNALIKAAQPALYAELEEAGLKIVSTSYLANLEVRPTLVDQTKEVNWLIFTYLG